MSVWPIIVGVILIVVGSFAWIRPSKREVRLAHWRQSAIEQGLQIKFLSFDPDPENSGVQAPMEGIRYRWIDPKKVHEQASRCWTVTTQKGWYNQGLPEGWYWVYPIAPQSQPPQQTIKAACDAINTLPIRADSTLLIQANRGSKSIIWNEANQPFDAAKLALFLQRI